MYGAVSGIAMVAIIIVLHFAGLDEKPGVGWLAYIPFLGGIVMNAIAFSKANDGYVTFKNLFGSGFKASMIVTLIVVGWTVVSLFLFPDMKEKAMELARTEMLKKPNMTDEAMDMAMNLMRKGYGTIIISSAVFGTLAMGAIFSLIGAGAAPKKGEKPIADNF